MTVVLVVVAGAAAAVTRHLVATAARDARLGVLAVNVAGNFVLGLLVGLRLDGEVRAGRWSEAATHVAASLALGLAAAALGLALV